MARRLDIKDILRRREIEFRAKYKKFEEETGLPYKLPFTDELNRSREERIEKERLAKEYNIALIFCLSMVIFGIILCVLFVIG